MKQLVSILFLLVYLYSNGQKLPERNWIDSELKYTDANGNLVKFLNSLPRGGGVVYKNGKRYSYVVFWTRVFNQSTKALDLIVKYPEVTNFKSPDSYIHVVLPKATMTMDKVQSLDYGLTNLQSILNDTSNQLNILQRKIQPNNEYTFYTAVFMHIAGWGPARAKFELKDQELFYKISLGSDNTLIPCGSLYFKN